MFTYPNTITGITINGHDLSEYSAKLQASYQIGSCAITTDLFQGKNRSSLLLLDQSFAPMEIVLPLEFWGNGRSDTMEKWSNFCLAASGKVELGLGDGFVYASAVSDFGKPAFISDGYLGADVTFLGFRQKALVTIPASTTIGASVFCESTFPRTDCVLTIPKALLSGANLVSVTLGENQWYLKKAFSSTAELVLDGVNKIFTLSGENVTAEMSWEDFPYLVPGDNPIGVYIDTAGVTAGIILKYRPTFL